MGKLDREWSALIDSNIVAAEFVEILEYVLVYVILDLWHYASFLLIMCQLLLLL